MQQLKNFEEALEIYSSIYKYNNFLKEIDYNIGLCYYHLSDPRKSADYLKKYLNSNPNHKQIYFHLCKVLNSLEAHEEINEVCEKAEI